MWVSKANSLNILEISFFFRNKLFVFNKFSKVIGYRVNKNKSYLGNWLFRKGCLLVYGVLGNFSKYTNGPR